MRYLTTGEVARRCQVSLGTVKNWIEAGQLAAFRTPGRHFRIRASELRRFQAAFGFGSETDQMPRILVVDDQQDFVDLVLDTLKDLLPGARVDARQEMRVLWCKPLGLADFPSPVPKVLAALPDLDYRR